MSSLYWSEKDGENIGIIVENKLINRLEINLECVIITFNHGFSVFNVWCGPRSIFMLSALWPSVDINVDIGRINALRFPALGRY